MKVKVAQSSPTLCQHLCSWTSPGQNTGVGSCSLLKGIFPTQGSNLGSFTTELPGKPHFVHVLILHSLNTGFFPSIFLTMPHGMWDCSSLIEDLT